MINNHLEFNTLSNFCIGKSITTTVLRLDKVHDIVSGNKWFKLQHYLNGAINKNVKKVVTFGGAYSNHIVATAFACKTLNIESIGIIRGEKPKFISHTLQEAESFGMNLIFVSREDYSKKTIPLEIQNETFFLVPEGGYGKLGATGIKDLLNQIDISLYTHIICSCGTGTTIAGIVQAALPQQKVIGINVLKGYEAIQLDIENICDNLSNFKNFSVLNNFHFNGYAKYNVELIKFMNDFFLAEKIETDFVYTAKMFYALQELINKNYFEKGSKILAIHTGGLQGNKSLTKGTLVF